MRNISDEVLAVLSTRLGTEPICIVEIDWVVGSASAYADKIVGGIPGKIVELSDLDDAVHTEGHSGSQQISLTLDDVDGTIKGILDTLDVHKRPARVYQAFVDPASYNSPGGISILGQFKLFSGLVTTPIIWSERDRTIKLTILSQLEVGEIDHSVEESLPGPVPSSLQGKNFPLVFGTVENVPAIQLQTPVSGVILQPVGVLAGEELLLKLPTGDVTDYEISLAKANHQINFLNDLITIFGDAIDSTLSQTESNDLPQALIDSTAANYSRLQDGYVQQRDNLNSQCVAAIFKQEQEAACATARRNKAVNDAKIQLGYGTNPVDVLGGEDFPQGPVSVDIGGSIFTGSMSGNKLTIDSRDSDYLTKLAQGAYNAKLNSAPGTIGADPCTLNSTIKQTWQWSAQVPTDTNGVWDGNSWYTYSPPPTQFSYTPNLAVFNNDAILQHLWLDAGSTVRLSGDQSLDYLVSATPGTVTAVRAMKSMGGVQLLVDVPNWTSRVEQFGDSSVTVVHLPKVLSSLPDEGWTDNLYVTFASSVGPNVADILQYLVARYTTLTCDAASFATARHFLAAANFVLNDFQDVLSLLRNIAFQACCEIEIIDGVVFIMYLPHRPDAVDMITVSDIDAERGVEVELTGTEELVTKMTLNWSTTPVVNTEHVSSKVWEGSQYLWTATWGYDPGALVSPHYSMVLRNNIHSYGTFSTTYSYFIYKDATTVEQCAGFWLARKSNTWKRVKFTTPLHKLNLEAFDAITLDLPALSCLALIESASYDSANNCIHFQCITPVRAGMTEEDPTFWPR